MLFVVVDWIKPISKSVRSNLILCKVVLLLNFIFPRVMSNKLYCYGETQSKLVRFPFVLICNNFLSLLTLSRGRSQLHFMLPVYTSHCNVLFHSVKFPQHNTGEMKCIFFGNVLLKHRMCRQWIKVFSIKRLLYWLNWIFQPMAFIF